MIKRVYLSTDVIVAFVLIPYRCYPLLTQFLFGLFRNAMSLGWVFQVFSEFAHHYLLNCFILGHGAFFV
jgi:hypothetical protein